MRKPWAIISTPAMAITTLMMNCFFLVLDTIACVNLPQCLPLYFMKFIYFTKLVDHQDFDWKGKLMEIPHSVKTDKWFYKIYTQMKII
jgi:hypothetical protein